MAAKPDVSGYERFSDVTSRLDEIVLAVRDKNTPLERSLDLFDEAIALGTRAVDLVDKAAFSPEERERMVDVDSRGENADAGTEAGSGKDAETVSAEVSATEAGVDAGESEATAPEATATSQDNA